MGLTNCQIYYQNKNAMRPGPDLFLSGPSRPTLIKYVHMDRMQRLVAFGCSNTLGEGLEGFQWRQPHPRAWPAVLGQQLNRPVLNLGHSGASNRYIMDRVLNTPLTRTDTVVIMWTSFARHCWFGAGGQVRRALPHDIGRPHEWPHNGPESDSQLSEIYYQHIWSAHDAWHASMTQINWTQAYLQRLGVRCLHLLWWEGDHHLDRPSWNQTLIHNLPFSQEDRAPDGHHPGVNSHHTQALRIQELLFQTHPNHPATLRLAS